jgi:hypothetical protein
LSVISPINEATHISREQFGSQRVGLPQLLDQTRFSGVPSQENNLTTGRFRTSSDFIGTQLALK